MVEPRWVSQPLTLPAGFTTAMSLNLKRNDDKNTSFYDQLIQALEQVGGMDTVLVWLHVLE